MTDDPHAVIFVIRRAMKHPNVPTYLLKRTDNAVTKDDLVQECYCYLLSKLPGYKPELSNIEGWVYSKAYWFFLSYFRQLTARKESRKRHVAKMKKGEKGVVRKGRVYDMPPIMSDAETSDSAGFVTDNNQDEQIYNQTGREADPRPGNEWLIDLHDSIAKLPEHLRVIAEHVIEGHDTDKIAWLMNVHPSTITEKVVKVKDLLEEMLLE